MSASHLKSGSEGHLLRIGILPEVVLVHVLVQTIRALLARHPDLLGLNVIQGMRVLHPGAIKFIGHRLVEHGLAHRVEDSVWRGLW